MSLLPQKSEPVCLTESQIETLWTAYRTMFKDAAPRDWLVTHFAGNGWHPAKVTVIKMADPVEAIYTVSRADGLKKSVDLRAFFGMYQRMRQRREAGLLEPDEWSATAVPFDDWTAALKASLWFHKDGAHDEGPLSAHDGLAIGAKLGLRF